MHFRTFFLLSCRITCTTSAETATQETQGMIPRKGIIVEDPSQKIRRDEIKKETRFWGKGTRTKEKEHHHMDEYSNWVGRLTDTWSRPPSWLWAYQTNIHRACDSLISVII